VTVNAVNDPPTLDAISDLVIDEDAGAQAIDLTGISAGANENQALSISASSSNPALIAPAVSYSSPNISGSLTFTPAANASGTALITVTVNDGGAQNNTLTRSFTVTVNAVNDVPAISPIANQTIEESVGTLSIPFTVADVETPSADLLVTARSGNAALVDPAGIVLSGAGADRVISISPQTNQTGVAQISIVVTDGGGASATNQFSLTVTPVPPPQIVTQPQSVTTTNNGSVTLRVVANGAGPLSFQWRHNGADLTGMTNSVLALSNVQSSDSGSYTVVVSNRRGSLTSVAAQVRVLAAPAIVRIVHSAGGTAVAFTSVSGLTYTLAASRSLTDVWQSIDTRTALGAETTLSDAAVNDEVRFYRIRVE
jgi:hypothetical protein